MHTKLITCEDFLSTFTFRKDVSLHDFCKSIILLRNTGRHATDFVTIDDYLTKNNSHERQARLPTFLTNLHKMLVVEPEEFLKYWFNEYGRLPQDIPYYFSFSGEPICEDGTFYGTTNSKYGRLCRQLNFTVAYSTKRNNNANHVHHTTLELLHLMFERFIVSSIFTQPVFFNLVCNIDTVGYRDFWKQLMSFIHKPSILNPYTYREILHTLFDGEVLFAPCASWNSCQLAFYNSQFSHFISTDVIPSVVENGKTLDLDWQDWNNSRSILFPEEKTVDLYLCPSEQLQKRHKFIDKYRGKVDAVLFCPPYFDLELYDSPEQSVDSFPDYQDWLKGYWEKTVKTCVEVMRPGARFGFIISNYRQRDDTPVPVSDDMGFIADKHLSLINKYKVQWEKFTSKKKTGKHKNGNFEDLWLFEKR